ncbi:MAG TPA: thiamine phosphate synthase [Methylovirgula sp.]
MAEALPRLYLMTPPLTEAAGFSPIFDAVLAAGDVACVFLRLAPQAMSEQKKIVGSLLPLAQLHNAALLLNDPVLAARSDADGVHVESIDALEAALAAMKPDKIVGVGGLASRHEAMRAGEAEVDYVMFGGPDASYDRDALLDRVAWWAEIFTVPCVAYAQTLEDVAPLVETGADFIALGDALWTHSEGAPSAIATAIKTIASVHEPTQ